MNEQRILTLASRLVTAGIIQNREEIAKISSELAAELRQQSGDGGRDGAHGDEESEVNFSGFLKFTPQEISKMPKQFSKLFRAEGCSVHYRKRFRSKLHAERYTYEARYRRHGLNISVYAETLDELKRKFIEALKRPAESKDNAVPEVPKNFGDFANYYFEKFRKRTVKEITFNNDLYRYRKYIKPHFGNMPLRNITSAFCQELFDSIPPKQNKTLLEVFSLTNVIFKMAIRHRLIEYNPLDIVIVKRTACEHGKALTKDEEKFLLERTAGTRYQLLFAVALYTGLRPNEFYTARIEEKFIIAQNSKRKNGRIEFKKIPITPMLRPYLAGVQELHFPLIEYMRDKLKEILPNHKLYDLRTTFYTRCHECGVSDAARMEFVGHSFGALGDAYTDLSEEYLLKEGEKLNY